MAIKKSFFIVDIEDREYLSINFDVPRDRLCVTDLQSGNYVELNKSEYKALILFLIKESEIIDTQL